MYQHASSIHHPHHVDLDHAPMIWCRVCGRYVSDQVGHFTGRRFRAAHSGPTEWPVAS